MSRSAYKSLTNTNDLSDLTDISCDNVTVNSSLDISAASLTGLGVDNTTIQFTSNQLSVKSGGIDTSQLSSSVQTTLTQVGTNTTNIATNTANIATNTANIATNTASITTLSGQISNKVDKITSTNNALVKFSGTGSTIANSAISESGGSLTGVVSLNDLTIGYYKFDGLKFGLVIGDGTSNENSMTMTGLGATMFKSPAWYQFVNNSYGVVCSRFSSFSMSDVTITAGIDNPTTEKINLNSPVYVYAGGTLYSDNITARSTNTNLVLSGAGTGVISCTSDIQGNKLISRSTNTDMTIEANGTGSIVLGTTSNATKCTANLSVLNGAGVYADALVANSTSTDLTLSTTTSSNVILCNRSTKVAAGKVLYSDTLSTTSTSTDLTIDTATNGQKIKLQQDVTVASGKTLRTNLLEATTSAATKITASSPIAINTTNNTVCCYVGTDTANGGTVGALNIKFDNGTIYASNVKPTSSGSFGVAVFYNSGGTAQGTITCSGSGATTYATSSDYRMKTNVANFDNGLDLLMKLRPVTYNWIGEGDIDVANSEARKRKGGVVYSGKKGDKTQGFIAHEVAPYVPYAVLGDKDAVNDDGSIKPQSLDLAKLVPMLVSAIQTLTARIEALEARGKK